jgi:hypothetical protein
VPIQIATIEKQQQKSVSSAGTSSLEKQKSPYKKNEKPLQVPRSFFCVKGKIILDLRPPRRIGFTIYNLR